MKIYLVENSKKIKKIKKYFDEAFTIEEKENCNFKMTKNDFVIIQDNMHNEGIEKLKNIVFLTENKDAKNIWKLACQYKTIDIIDSTLEEAYIAERIKKTIRRDI